MKRRYTVTDKVVKANRKKARLGGIATLEKHGREFYSKIGKMGYRAFHDKYKIQPWGLRDYALVDRETNLPVSLLSGDQLNENNR